MRAAFGVDVGGTSVKLGLVDGEGTLLDRWEIPTRIQEGGRHILEDVAGSIRERTDPTLDIAGVGLAVPGPVQEDGVVNRCLNLGWGRVDARAGLQELTGWPVAVGNDGSMAALGELWRGSARDCQDFVMITLGTGIGGGIVVKRRPLTGCHGSAGEIGHILVNADETEPCVCGNRGCMEQYASARALAARTAEYLRTQPECLTTLRAEGLTAREVTAAAERGDHVATKMLDGLAEALGRGTAILAAILDPQLFVIGGGLSRAGETLLSRIRAAYRRHVFHAARETPFALAALGNDAAIFGCARAVLFPE